MSFIMAKKNWMNEIFGGQILQRILRQVWFILFLFILIITYITLNFSMEQALLLERKNERDLKHLKSDYVSKSSRLQYESKRIEVEKKLIQLHSTLEAPENPPIRVTAD